MGRSLLLAETIINGEPIIVATSHLESLESPEERKLQMDTAFPLLKTVDNSFIMGDFNFDSSWTAE
jgi:endonuclease/exonuclease/phosphatase family metal-dependent hydrolase